MDKEAIRLKYAKERDKRLRADGNAQYITLDGQLSYYKTDPYVDFKERKPVNDHVRFCYVGGVCWFMHGGRCCRSWGKFEGRSNHRDWWGCGRYLVLEPLPRLHV